MTGFRCVPGNNRGVGYGPPPVNQATGKNKHASNSHPVVFHGCRIREANPGFEKVLSFLTKKDPGIETFYVARVLVLLRDKSPGEISIN